MLNVIEVIGDTLLKDVEKFLPQLQTLSEVDYTSKPSPVKWSKKEVIGHLIDSAENNIRRFIVAQYEDNPFIVYNQDEWVRINNYHQWSWADLVNLWHNLNKQLANMLKQMPSAVAQRTCRTSDSKTLAWLGEDYLKHLRHHLHRVLNLDPVDYP